MNNQYKKLSKILIVDDDPGIRDVLSSMLRSIIGEKADILAIENGEEAVTLSGRMTFDRVFTDMQMPGMDGLDTFRGIRKLHPNMKIILMTGAANPNRIDAALQEGAVGCIYKPFMLSDIKTVLEK